MPFPNKVSCFVSICVSSDNSFPIVRQEPSFGPWKGSAFLQHEDMRGNSWGLGVAFHGIPILLFLILLCISIITYILFSPIFIEPGKLKTKALYQFPLIIFPYFIEIRSLLKKDDFWLVLRLILEKKEKSNNHYLFFLLLCFQPSSHSLSWDFRWYKFRWLPTVSFFSQKNEL